MDNRETLATLGTQDTTKTKTKDTHNTAQHTKLKDEQYKPYQKPGEIPGAREG